MDTISVAVERGGLVESEHRVHAVAVRDDEVVDAWGDPGLVTFMRSAAKPFQALSLVRAYGDLAEEELAVACASHGAAPEQLAAVEALLVRSGSSEDDLECGPEGGRRLRHNCSGKHAGMLCACVARGWERRGYRLPDHPLQRELLALVEDATGSRVERTATDGCGVVTFALPLAAMASGFARLVRGELEGGAEVVAAMTRHPELVEGPGRTATEVMKAVPGSVAKGGAEGVLCVGLPDGTGLALKVADGASRATAPAAGRILGVRELAERPLLDSRGEDVGRIRPSAFPAAL
ncbi:MAG TPA: asparaginase [Gaiellaceae bacterium]|nr:asparaginase [Gaiellaceae bacterium]